MAKKKSDHYRMPKGYKGHPQITSSKDNGTQFGRNDVNTKETPYGPSAQNT